MGYSLICQKCGKITFFNFIVLSRVNLSPSFIFAELELKEDDDVGDEDAGDGQPTGVAQLEGGQGTDGAVLQNLTP